MSKGFCGLYDLSTKTPEVTKEKVRQHVNFMSNLIQHKLTHWLHIVCGHMIRILDNDKLADIWSAKLLDAIFNFGAADWVGRKFYFLHCWTCCVLAQAEKVSEEMQW